MIEKGYAGAYELTCDECGEDAGELFDDVMDVVFLRKTLQMIGVVGSLEVHGRIYVVSV